MTLFFGFSSPVLDDIKKLRADQAVIQGALDNAKELQGVRDNLLTKKRQISETDSTKIVKMLPDRVDNVRLIIDIDNIASRYGMSLRNVRINTDGVSEGLNKKYESVTLSFAVQGSYQTFRQFIADLEKSLRIVDVTNVSFTSGDKDLYDFNIELQTYWIK